MFLIIGFNSNIISWSSGNGIFNIRILSFSFNIILLLSILSFISSNISSKLSNCKKYFASLIPSNEYLFEYDLWIILLIWLAVISI